MCRVHRAACIAHPATLARDCGIKKNEHTRTRTYNTHASKHARKHTRTESAQMYTEGEAPHAGQLCVAVSYASPPAGDCGGTPSEPDGKPSESASGVQARPRAGSPPATPATSRNGGEGVSETSCMPPSLDPRNHGEISNFSLHVDQRGSPFGRKGQEVGAWRRELKSLRMCVKGTESPGQVSSYRDVAHKANVL